MRRAWFACACGLGVACGGVSTGSADRTIGPSPKEAGPASTMDAATDSVADATPGAASDGASGSGNDVFTEMDDAATDADMPVAMLGSVAIGLDGRASGAINGYTWVSLAPGAMGTTHRGPNQLCIQGTIAAVVCTPNTAVNGDACNWSSNWGVDLGFDTTNPRGPWGSAAPTMLAVSYAGTPGTYNLLAHLTGDPDSQWYGIPNYASGQLVSASALRLQYWTVPPSTALSGFQNVDMLAVFLDAEPTNVTYDFCVTGITTH